MSRSLRIVASPPFKCPGGKRQLLPELLARVPERFEVYHEPFVGGGALFFALAARRRICLAHLNDANPHVYHTYWAIQHNVEELIDRLRLGENTPEYYESVRAVDPRSLNYVREAAWFLYLTRTSFNGLFRVNRKGKFNAPFGRYKNPKICDEANLRAVSRALRGVDISGVDFEKAPRPEDGDFVYCDPPYPPLSKTADFDAYTAGGFSWADHQRLAHHARGLKEQGIYVLLSNSDQPRVRELYGDLGFQIELVEARRNVNSDGAKRGPVGELLIT